MARHAAGHELGESFEWGEVAPLRIRSRLLAEGVYAGSHRSARRGTGIEFGGHREYIPGDDLRWLDRRALLRHGRLLVRQFETETDRALRLVVDASASMAYRGEKRARDSKLGTAALLAAVLARVAIASGDPVGLTYFGGEDSRPVAVAGGREGFDRVLGSLELVRAGGDAVKDPALLDRALGVLSRAARRGSVVVVMSDLFDMPDDAAERFAALAARGRSVVVVQILDPDEIDLPFEGTVRLRAIEGDAIIETDAEDARGAYRESLAKLESHYKDTLVSRGARFVRASTGENPADTVRAIIAAIR